MANLDHIDFELLAKEAKFRPGDMAALCSISLRHLERFFASAMHQSVRQWTRCLRCRLAAELISHGWSNKAVVVELGFSNEAHLCHEFKSIYGRPPQSFAPLSPAAARCRI
jgi:transcriptional regulator GlxA family with amidase domain